MSTIALTNKAAKLMKLCDLEGYKRLHDLLKAAASDSLCPAICMTEGCDYTTEMESDQDAGYCERCGGNTMASALVLAGNHLMEAGKQFRNYYRCAECGCEWTDWLFKDWGVGRDWRWVL
jgi:hypothetical protein